MATLISYDQGYRVGDLVTTDDDYTVTDEVLVEVTDTSEPRVITLPPAQFRTPGVVLTVKDGSGAADETNTITLQPDGSEEIDGAESLVIQVAFDAVRLYSNGQAWRVLEEPAEPSA